MYVFAEACVYVREYTGASKRDRSVCISRTLDTVTEPVLFFRLLRRHASPHLTRLQGAPAGL